MPSGKVIAGFKSVPFAIEAKPDALSLKMMVKKAIDKLNNEKGFLLITVGGKINRAAEKHDTATLIREMKAFDQEIQTAWDFYKTHNQETLIVVSGTVETGGLILGVNSVADLNAGVFKNQKVSLDTFEFKIDRFRQRRKEGAVLEDFMP